MNPLCGRCNRVVYPTEKVNCLDKCVYRLISTEIFRGSRYFSNKRHQPVRGLCREEEEYWHKGCFSCEVCKMTLNMKNYKGFEKRPYCNAFSCVFVLQVLYKEEFEKNKGRGFSAVADTPEMQRIKKTQDQISNIKYHEDFEKSRMGGEGPPQHPQTPQQITTPAYQPPAASKNYHYEPEPVRQAAAAPPPSSGKRYRAVYDYTAADEDEVSFLDGDLIMDVQQIDEGWMYGRVERTGQQGMLPANYVEAI
ncbi:hypothetical protein PO909_001801 [Leuciscus waleckii]